MPLSESKFLERCRVALKNAESNVEVRTALNTFGMNTAKIAEGKQILANAKLVYEQTLKEKAESKIASSIYQQSFDELDTIFKRHRSQTLIFFRKKPEILVTLGVQGRLPQTYSNFFDKVGQFYNGIKNNPAIQTEMNKIFITDKIVADAQSKLQILLANRAAFDKEFGEAQDATKSKHAAFDNLADWMDDFDAVAKVALFDRPQLLEVLGIRVRS